MRVLLFKFIFENSQLLSFQLIIVGRAQSSKVRLPGAAVFPVWIGPCGIEISASGGRERAMLSLSKSANLLDLGKTQHHLAGRLRLVDKLQALIHGHHIERGSSSGCWVGRAKRRVLFAECVAKRKSAKNASLALASIQPAREREAGPESLSGCPLEMATVVLASMRITRTFKARFGSCCADLQQY